MHAVVARGDENVVYFKRMSLRLCGGTKVQAHSQHVTALRLSAYPYGNSSHWTAVTRSLVPYCTVLRDPLRTVVQL